MGLYRRGRIFWMNFSYHGKQYRQSTETEDKRIARRILDKVKGEIAEGKWCEKLPGEDRTFKEMMEKYMTEYSIPQKASAERDQSSLTHLSPFFGHLTLLEITPKLVSQYKASRRSEKASPCTINRELALAKHAFSHAIKEWEWLNENPVKSVSMEKEPASRDRWLTYLEEEKLLGLSPEWLKEILVFALETGCRRGEIFSLQWRDVNLFQKVITIFGKKTGERRGIPLTERAFELLQAKGKTSIQARSINGLVFTHPTGQKVNINTFRGAFARAIEKAGIEDFRFHDLRHTFASRLAQAGIDPYTSQRLMGHKNFATTQRYAHHYSESLRNGIEALEASRVESFKELSQFYHSRQKNSLSAGEASCESP